MQKRICGIVEATQYGLELQVCLLVAVQPWVTHLTSLGIAFSTSKMGMIILNQALLTRLLLRSAENTKHRVLLSYLLGWVSFCLQFKEPSWNDFLSISSWLEQNFSIWIQAPFIRIFQSSPFWGIWPQDTSHLEPNLTSLSHVFPLGKLKGFHQALQVCIVPSFFSSPCSPDSPKQG